jgi:DNA polymerase III delta prime subunit
MKPDYSPLLIHQNTKSQLEAFYSHPGSALLITGRIGSGKLAIARHLSAWLLGVATDKLPNHPEFLYISTPPDKTEISIDSVRQLISKMALKVPSGHETTVSINRIALVEDAGSMSHEAQNAMLKLLEEPPAGTLLVLTADSADDLLPTVVSRTQMIKIIAPGLEQSREYFKDSYNLQAIDSAYSLSQGAPGLLSALLAEQTDHPLKIGVEQAKKFLKQTTYQRLIELQTISKDRIQFVIFLDALARVLSALHAENIKANQAKNAAKILGARKVVERALTLSTTNANQRLSYLALALDIPL